MEKKFLDILVCPVTKGKLEYHQDKQELWSRQAKLAYPIRDGIPYMLENEARAVPYNQLRSHEPPVTRQCRFQLEQKKNTKRS